VKEGTGFNIGTTYDFSENWHLLASVGTGIQNQSTTNQFSYYLAVQLTF
jgi:outer membrane cobalamin receptor